MINGVTRRPNDNGNGNGDDNNPKSTVVKSIKLFGVDFNLNVDQLPGIESLVRLEMTNLKMKSAGALRSARTYPNLTEFYFKNNQLKQLSALNAFYVFTGLKVASFAQNLLERIDRDTFKFSSLKLLEELNLERNKLVQIDKDSFGDNLVNLRVLNLNQNNIAKIDDKAFAKLDKLETLDLTRNR